MKTIFSVATIVILSCTCQLAEAQEIWYTPSGQPYGYLYGLDLGNGVGYGYGIGVRLAENASGLNAYVASDFTLSATPNLSTDSEFVGNGEESTVHQIVSSQTTKKIVKGKKTATSISGKKKP